MSEYIALSFVIPLLNEEGSLRQLWDEIRAVMKELRETRYEVIFIDDGSTDGSYGILQELHQRWPDKVRVIRFRGNFGKSSALAVGFERARGDLIFSMDADLQDDPREVPNFLKRLYEGFDMVSGWKRKRHDPFIKRLLSKVFNATMRSVSGIPLHDFNCGFKLYRAEVINSLDVYGEMHRFLPIYANAAGFTVAEVEVNHRPRPFGASKYGWERLYRGLFDAISVLLLSKYLKKPMHFFGSVGLILGTVGFLILSYFTILKMIGYTIGFRPLFFAGILFMLSGIQVLTFGLISELFVRFNHKHTDPYSIKDELGTSFATPQHVYTTPVALPVSKTLPALPALSSAKEKSPDSKTTSGQTPKKKKKRKKKKKK